MASLNPDDVCGVCDVTRENHGDSQHQFSIDGVLRKLEPAPPPRMQPPRAQGDTALLLKLQADAHMRLVETLVSKGILDAADLIKIMGGGDVVLSTEPTSAEEAG